MRRGGKDFLSCTVVIVFLTRGGGGTGTFKFPSNNPPHVLLNFSPSTLDVSHRCLSPIGRALNDERFEGEHEFR